MQCSLDLCLDGEGGGGAFAGLGGGAPCLVGVGRGGGGGAGEWQSRDGEQRSHGQQGVGAAPPPAHRGFRGGVRGRHGGAPRSKRRRSLGCRDNRKTGTDLGHRTFSNHCRDLILIEKYPAPGGTWGRRPQEIRPLYARGEVAVV